jgi:hypothetical protein
MSINPIQSSASSLPALHLPGHGHKKGIHGDSQAEAAALTSTTDQEPTGSTQNLFGSILDSVEQIIGVKPAAAAAGAAVTAATLTQNAPKV